VENHERRDEPFFARFLEGQFPNVKTDLKAGKPFGGGGGDNPVTLKYPSDDDEGGETV
jgi:hypothetical protein